MSGNLPIGSIRGIRLLINWSWLLIFALVAWSLATGYFPANFKHWSEGEYWAVAVAAALLLFVSVLIHELSHSFVAQARGLPVSTITLYVFGGVSNLTREPSSAGEEFWIAFAGPLSSIALGVIFGLLHQALAKPDWLSAIFGYLGAINLVLALFNLIPAFPLDGGRVFRAIAWGITHDLRRATRIATLLGQGIAWLFILVGIWYVFTGNILGGIWLAFIGWFLNNAATSSYRYAQQSGELRSVDVATIMTPNPPTISTGDSLGSVIYGHLLQESLRAIPVIGEKGELAGLLTVTDVRHFPPDRWAATPVADAMTPRSKLDVVTPDTHVLDAMNIMNLHGHNQLPVVQDGRAIGLLRRSDLLRYLQSRHAAVAPASTAAEAPSRR
ncbi:MAG TPA: site-2 protease family protein [Chloroflexota bacterium]|nr:site-2 protease family protein [Chloroflexota bacterium]